MVSDGIVVGGEWCWWLQYISVGVGGWSGGAGNEKSGGRSGGGSCSGGVVLVVVIVAMSAVIGVVLPQPASAQQQWWCTKNNGDDYNYGVQCFECVEQETTSCKYTYNDTNTIQYHGT